MYSDIGYRSPSGQILTATGEVPGPKGLDTRERLLDEVEARCTRVHYRDLTVAEVAEALGISAGTFYHYFPDLTSAVAEVTADRMRGFEAVVDMAEQISARGASTLGDCRALAGRFVAFWEAQPGLLEIIDRASSDEDPRVFRPMYDALHDLTDALAAGITRGTPEGVAGVLVMMLNHTTVQLAAFAESDIGRDEVIESLALVLHATLTGCGGPGLGSSGQEGGGPDVGRPGVREGR